MHCSIRCDHKESLEYAQFLAQTFKIALNQEADCYLSVDEHGVKLHYGTFKPIMVDFCRGAVARRINQAGKQQLLAKACAVKTKPRVLDLTAGWGRDAAILASLGAQVTMLERNPVQALLLSDGLRRMHQANLMLPLKLVHCDALDYLQKMGKQNVDVIYLDPMHPCREKSALVKKEMQILQQLVGLDSDKLKLGTLALTKAAKRLVIKWPRKRQGLLPSAPDLSFTGKTIRYDVYLARQS